MRVTNIPNLTEILTQVNKKSTEQATSLRLQERLEAQRDSTIAKLTFVNYDLIEAQSPYKISFIKDDTVYPNDADNYKIILHNARRNDMAFLATVSFSKHKDEITFTRDQNLHMQKHRFDIPPLISMPVEPQIYTFAKQEKLQSDLMTLLIEAFPAIKNSLVKHTKLDLTPHS